MRRVVAAGSSRKKVTTMALKALTCLGRAWRRVGASVGAEGGAWDDGGGGGFRVGAGERRMPVGAWVGWHLAQQAQQAEEAQREHGADGGAVVEAVGQRDEDGDGDGRQGDGGVEARERRAGELAPGQQEALEADLEEEEGGEEGLEGAQAHCAVRVATARCGHAGVNPEGDRGDHENHVQLCGVGGRGEG